MSRLLILSGLLLVLVGVVFHLAPWLFTWFGRLPGDLRIESEQSKIFIPITSMLLVSVVFSLLLHLFQRWK